MAFVIGSGNPQYHENLKMAQMLHDTMTQMYPGISRDLIIKDNSQGNGIYNQDLSKNSVIVEIGGVENTMEELYRSADVLGFGISEYYWDNLH
ncbi:stage II sporulation protein P [Bacillus sp. DJP31]|uniref:stage II sporulation protein P n=1 Tax=Bacillus sp. DJP31 TaxID=3409789 RepID=UPI003BB5B4E5